MLKKREHPVKARVLGVADVGVIQGLGKPGLKTVVRMPV